MDRKGKAALRHRQLLVSAIGGDDSREEFTRIWMQSGKTPGLAIRKRWPVLALDEPRLIAEYWELPRPTQLPAKKQPVPIDVLAERIWLYLEPRVQQMIDEAFA